MASSIPQCRPSIVLSFVGPPAEVIPNFNNFTPPLMTLPCSHQCRCCSGPLCSSLLPLLFLVQAQRQFPGSAQSPLLVSQSSVHSWDPSLLLLQVPGLLDAFSPAGDTPVRAAAPHLAHSVKDRGVAPDPLRPPVDID